ncbi:MAG: hypothetical protein HUK07_06240 [Bacteroidaceae bacterium]|nr:hypothetical protein [Bacteroidaceae bacterium]
MKSLMKGMMLALTTCIAMVSCSTDDSDSSKPNPTPEAKSKMKYEIKVEADSSVTFNINESHQTLYPIYKDYLQLVEEANKKFNKTIELDYYGGFGPNEQAISETKAARDEAVNYINPKAEELRKRISAAEANASEIEKLTAMLSHGIKVVLYKNASLTDQVHTDEIKDVLTFNKGKHVFSLYLSSICKFTGLFNDATPTLKSAWLASNRLVRNDFDSYIKAVNEGSCSLEEKIVLPYEEAKDEAKMLDIANKVMGKRIAAAKEWAKTAQEKFVNKYKTYNVPQAEAEQTSTGVTINVNLSTLNHSPFKGKNLTDEIAFDLKNI